jgi:hypothetical protein
MALKGTLKDFGIADILQLIGQQQKTGTLNLKNKDQEVQVGFKDGSIVRAESSTRKKKELIGAMLVRAEIITEAQLEQALETQRRTLKRLGDVLVASKALTRERFHQMVQLQVSETLFRLFGWKNGTYAFEQGEVEHDAEAIKPLRAENVLMEGFRMVDEWPMIRRKIPSYDVTFEKLKELPPAPVEQDDFDADFDDAFAEEKPAEKKGDFASLGRTERTVHAFVMSGRGVRKIIDLTCIGEFETCKALTNLVNLEYLKVVPGKDKSQAVGAEAGFFDRARGATGRVLLTALVLVAVGAVATQVDLTGLAEAPTTSISDPAAQRFVSRSQLKRIEAALKIYQLEKGELPEGLDALVEAKLLQSDDIRFPWHDPYYYRRVEPARFILLPPLR